MPIALMTVTGTTQITGASLSAIAWLYLILMPAGALLDLPRAPVRAWAEARGLQWIVDDSNTDTRFDRNFLRHDVLPTLLGRWPGAARAVARSASHMAEARGLLDAVAR